MPKSAVSQPLVWIDCEVRTQDEPFRDDRLTAAQMTGLDPDNDIIIEVFCIITNGDLDVIDEAGWGCTIHQSKERMDQMDEWCVKTHGETGLTSAVIASTTTAEEAAAELLAYIKKHIPQPRSALLAGNSVHADKAFLRYAPWTKVHDHLSYRILDVSTIKEAVRRWSTQEVLNGVPEKKVLHQAKEDILESIEEARYYRTAIFQAPTKRQEINHS
jgi:oligoribonuclease